MSHPKHSTFNWLTVGNGKITLSKRPTESDMQTLQGYGITHIATIQTEEDAQPELKTAVEQQGLNWIWLPFQVSDLYLEDENERMFLSQYLYEVASALKEGATVYLHCDGHATRCRLFLYALCIYLKMPASNAYNVIHSLGANQANQLKRTDLTQAAKLVKA